MSSTTFGIIIAAAIFVGISALAALLVAAHDSRGSRRLQRRMSLQAGVGTEFDGYAGDRGLLQTFARGGQKIEKFVDKEGETGQLLMQAGWRDTTSRLGFNILQGLLPVLILSAVAIGWIFVGGKLFTVPYVLLVLATALIISLLIPRWVLRKAASNRQARIKREVPLFAHLLVLLFEAGLSTRQALATIVRDGSGVLPELGIEFEAAVRQFDSGGDTGEVLRDISALLAVDDLANILSILRQVDRYGGEVREPLLDMLKLFEERHSLEMRERVNILSGRMTVVMVLFFFPALMIFVAGPAVASLLQAFTTVNGK